jgi:hypothetical protein
MVASVEAFCCGEHQSVISSVSVTTWMIKITTAGRAVVVGATKSGRGSMQDADDSDGQKPIYRRRSRGARAQGDASWVLLAARVMRLLGSAAYGDREVMYSDIAKREGLNPHTVRRAVASFVFLEQLGELGQREIADRLKREPVAAVEHLARWYRHAPATALAAAADLIAGRYTVRSLGAQAGNALEDSPTFKPRGRGRELTFRRQVRKVVDKIPGANEVPHSTEDPRIDFLVNLGAYKCAVLIAGPYADDTQYSKRRNDWMLKALGLTALGYKVVLVVPSNGDVENYEDWLRYHRVNTSTQKIKIVDGSGVESAILGSWQA